MNTAAVKNESLGHGCTLTEKTGASSMKGLQPTQEEKDFLRRKFSGRQGIIPIKELRAAIIDYRTEK